MPAPQNVSPLGERIEHGVIVEALSPIEIFGVFHQAVAIDKRFAERSVFTHQKLLHLGIVEPVEHGRSKPIGDSEQYTSCFLNSHAVVDINQAERQLV